MNLTQLIRAVFYGRDDLGQESQRLVEIKYTDLFTTLLIQFDLVLFDSRVIQEDWVTFLDLDERYDFMKCGLHYRISLVVIFHQLFETTEGHSEHFSKSHGIHSVLLCMEHAWLSRLNIFKLINFAVISTDSLVLDLSLGMLVNDISFWEFLP